MSFPNSYPSTPCLICGKEVSLRDCKTDEHGRAVHEECYAQQLKLDNRAAGTGSGTGFVS